MRRAIFWAFLFVLGSSVLAVTVFNGQISAATKAGSAPVTEQNVDSNSFIRVHEQGTASVSGTVKLDSSNNTVKLDPSGNTQSSG